MRTLLLSAFVATTAVVAAATAACAAARPPNIVYILADDIGYGDLGCYGQKKLATPNLDRLAAEGMRFTRHYSGSTVCAPSRSCLLTGLHTGHTPIRGNLEIKPEGQHPLPAGIVTLPKVLQPAGYVSGVFGKWGLGYPGSEGTPLKQGFDRFFGYNCQRLDHHYYPRHLWDGERQVLLEDNAGTLKGTYAPELCQRKALEFIEANRDRPFFCYVASPLPHAELDAPERYLARHRGKYGDETPYAGVDDGPEYRNGPYGSQAHPHAAFAAMMEILDEQVGEIVARVRALGLAENTLIIFTSDNGPHREAGADPEYFGSSGGLRGIKRDLYEGGIRVPMIAWWPGVIRPGSESAHVSAFWDVLPTAAELAGVSTPAGLDGISFAPTLTGRGRQAEHDQLYWEFHEAGGRMALLRGDWKIVRYDVLEHPDAPAELYDLASDPGETTNVAAQHPDRVRVMDAAMRAARVDSPVFRFAHKGYLMNQ